MEWPLHMHNLLDPYQSGFRTGHSTTTALLKVTEDIREAMDPRELTVLTLLDFSKAFDTVDHDLLIQKLKHLYYLIAQLRGFTPTSASANNTYH